MRRFRRYKLWRTVRVKTNRIINQKNKEMKKITLLSLALMLAGFISTAQNNRMAPHYFSSQHPQREYSDFDYSDMKNPYLLLHKTKSGEDWWQPDTIYMYPPNSEQPSHREVFSYNAQELVTVHLRQSWQNNNWMNSDKDTYTYDAQNNLLTFLTQNWQNDNWVNDYKFTYTYDTQNNQLTFLFQNWQNNNWVNNRKDTYTYDTQNNPLTRLSQSWHGSWVNDIRNTYTYDAQNNLITYLSQGWYGSWVNSWKDTYTYDAQNNLLTSLFQSWENGNWANIYKDIYTYDTQNNRLTLLLQIWQTDDWANIYKYTNTYDMQNNMLTLVIQNWQTDNWVNINKGTYTYDTQNNLITYLSQGWYGNWVNSNKSMWTYDENNNGTAVAYWVWQDEDWQQGTDFLALFYNNMQSHIWAYASGHKRTATYSKLMTSIAENAAVNITVYPNPTNGQLQMKSYELQVTSISLFDIYGRSMQVPSVSLSSPETVIDLSHLPSGLYFVKIYTTVGEVVKKVLKE